MNPPNASRDDRLIVTAALTTRVVRVARGRDAAIELVDEILSMDHRDRETSLSIGDVEFYQSKTGGPFPNHQFRLSVRPSSAVGACNYIDNLDLIMPVAYSWNPDKSWPDVDLILNGSTGAVFPPWSVISIDDVCRSLLEWLDTQKRPTCIQWRPSELW
ncbi:Imm1 family immunity protein [Labedaea rhizosphaerae]|uniref:Imm1 family immunity protein n=1 Tax=Labedaea rhizosphaerae TaxID=598644 RepID=UPI00105D8525